ncbi:MAG: tryptophanase, partial [Bacteroidales bacterium]|nr:tryptophanase [Bacteroidales bacterium]
MNLPFAEPYKIKMVETIRKSSRVEREQWIKEACYNLFSLRSEQVFIDLLTDSGTGSMSDKQWSAMMEGDESYAGARSYYRLQEVICETIGYPYFLPTHQGRAAENVLFSSMVKAGDILPGNAHFDTTKGHIEFRKAQAIDCTIAEAFDTTYECPFKGNFDLNKLEEVLKKYPKEQIPCIVVTVTNNTAGGQPVSMENIKRVAALAQKYGVKILIDAARFAENAYFIKTREQGYADKGIREIVKEMFSYADFMTMSAKKDAIVNMGGFISFRHREDWEKCQMYTIIYEGFITYGGMSGRDMNALAQGLI